MDAARKQRKHDAPPSHFKSLIEMASTASLLRDNPKAPPRAWIASAAALLDEGNADRRRGDIDLAYVKLTKGISICIEVLPKHLDFNVNDPQYSQLRRRIDQAFPVVENLKQQILDRESQRSAEPTRIPPSSSSASLSGSKSTPAGPAVLAAQQAVPARQTPLRLPSLLDSSISDIVDASLSSSARPPGRNVNSSNSNARTISCEQLYDTLLHLDKSVLIFDVRPTEDFITGHVLWRRPRNASNPLHFGGVVNIEPIWLNNQHQIQTEDIRRFLTAFGASTLTPTRLFSARADYDLIVVHDAASMTIEESPDIAKLISIIYDFEFNNIPKAQPVLLRGGYRAWASFIGTFGYSTVNWIEIGEGCGILELDHFRPPAAGNTQSSLDGINSNPASAAPLSNPIEPIQQPSNARSINPARAAHLVPTQLSTAPVTSSVAAKISALDGANRKDSQTNLQPQQPSQTQIIRSAHEYVNQRAQKLAVPKPSTSQLLTHSKQASEPPQQYPVTTQTDSKPQTQSQIHSPSSYSNFNLFDDPFSTFQRLTISSNSVAPRLDTPHQESNSERTLPSWIPVENDINFRPGPSQPIAAMAYPGMPSSDNSAFVGGSGKNTTTAYSRVGHDPTIQNNADLSSYPPVKYPSVHESSDRNSKRSSFSQFDINDEIDSFRTNYPELSPVDIEPRVPETSQAASAPPPALPPKPSAVSSAPNSIHDGSSSSGRFNAESNHLHNRSQSTVPPNMSSNSNGHIKAHPNDALQNSQSFLPRPPTDRPVAFATNLSAIPIASPAPSNMHTAQKNGMHVMQPAKYQPSQQPQYIQQPQPQHQHQQQAYSRPQLDLPMTPTAPPPAMFIRRSSSPSPSPTTQRFYQPLPESYMRMGNMPPPPPPAVVQGHQPPTLPPKSVKPIPGATSNAFAQDMSSALILQLGSTNIGMTGLKNLGNTCFMNSMIQCLSATVPMTRFFLDGSYRKYINRQNHLGSKGRVAESYSELVRSIWRGQDTVHVPSQFKNTVGGMHPSFSGSEQQDSQEFLAFLLDALHEDLNVARNGAELRRIKEADVDSEGIPDDVLLEQEWHKYRSRNWSIVVDMFQGCLKSVLTCMACGKTSTTFNPFMYLTLPIPRTNHQGVKNGSVLLEDCIRLFVDEEILDGDDAWHCPRCKQKRRATKRLSIARLPPILLIHLKRFSFQGPFRDKVETYVHFRTTNLNLTPFVMPARPVPGASASRPETYAYDLYAISSHYGGLNGGHYMAQVKNNYHGKWYNFDDSRITQTDEKSILDRDTDFNAQLVGW